MYIRDKKQQEKRNEKEEEVIEDIVIDDTQENDSERTRLIMVVFIGRRFVVASFSFVLLLFIALCRSKIDSLLRMIMP
jgi:hypothetical protein